MEPTRERLTGSRFLTGRADEYTDPVGAVAYQLLMLLRSYEAQGGDLENVTLTVGTDRPTRSRVSRHVTRVDLHGYSA